MSKTYQKPYFHIHIPDFLTPKEYEKLLKVYAQNQFKEKQSDLFDFYQTDQLASQKNLTFFMDSLSKQFSKLCTPEEFKQSFYTIFASYYFQGAYLLCHDDIVQDRKYAFSYYLEDFDHGGELVLFNDKANKVAKKFKVKKNTLVIFQVCDVSYHEVAYCTQGGRKAVTGWFNVKGQGAKRTPKQIDTFISNKITDALVYPLDQAHIEEEFFQMQDVQYQFNIKKQTVQGPFYSRKLHRLTIDPVVVFSVPGYSLQSSDFFRVAQGDYLLLNDPINSMENDDIIDIFVTSVPPGFHEQNNQLEEGEEDQANILIKMVQEDGSVNVIPAIDDSLFIVKRGKKHYYIERNKKQFKFAHFTFKKDNKVKKELKVAKKTENKQKSKNIKKQKLSGNLKKNDKKNQSKPTKISKRDHKNQVQSKKQLPKLKNSKRIAKPIKKQDKRKNKK